jgi:glycosyltransferase involved in cell wall biosynthesis
VLLEAMASGTPVAAYPVPGPLDVVRHGESGFLGEDLRAAALAALELDREAVRRHALGFSWQRATSEFLTHLRPDHARPGPA